MQVAKWGNSLAIRIPADMARRLGIKEGDNLEVVAADDEQIAVARKRTREEALERFLSRRVSLPEGYRFDREELYDDRDPL
ncbi:hypothetical protein IP88_01620 [alpha proteobacterium AAP81b]|nr:hypothetical protein IP88_01620 [alpha proteobacterium AAP81b]